MTDTEGARASSEDQPSARLRNTVVDTDARVHTTAFMAFHDEQGRSQVQTGRREGRRRIRLATLGYLRTHRDWYRRWSLFFTIAWNSCALAIVVIGIATSVLTAIDEKILAAPKLLLILLPAVSSLLGAILTQFRLRELARIRDEGRIRAEQLVCRAFLVPTSTKEAAMAEAVKLREAAHQLEREQLDLYMGDDANALKPPKASGATM